jgi:HAMP domain-containing protein
MRHAILEAARKRNIERQQRIVADTEKIVRLAQELSAAGAPADLMAKKSEEIEKLARGVRERMRTE